MASPMDAGATENEEDMVASEQSSEDSSDSDGDDLVEDVSLEDMATISRLETDLEANSNLYDVHLQVMGTFNSHAQCKTLGSRCPCVHLFTRLGRLLILIVTLVF